jgi:flagellar hook-associated protein 1 FlgK
LAGFTGLINNILNFALGTQQQQVVPQTAPATSGLGPAGSLAAPFAAPSSLSDFAAGITASQAGDAATASGNAADTSGTQAALSASLQSQTGVDMDSQLSLLIMDAIQDMYTQLLQAVQ